MKKGNEKTVAEKKITSKKNTGEKKVASKKNKHYIAEKRVVKVKKENIFKKIGKYFKGVFKEIKRIRWTEKKDLFKYSVCTLVFVLFFGVYFYAIDWIVLLIRSLAN